MYGVLEPTKSVEVTLPNDMVGMILSDLNGRRGNTNTTLVTLKIIFSWLRIFFQQHMEKQKKFFAFFPLVRLRIGTGRFRSIFFACCYCLDLKRHHRIRPKHVHWPCRRRAVREVPVAIYCIPGVSYISWLPNESA